MAKIHPEINVGTPQSTLSFLGGPRSSSFRYEGFDGDRRKGFG